MNRLQLAIVLALGVTAGAAAGYWYARSPAVLPVSVSAVQPTANAAIAATTARQHTPTR